LGAPLPGRDGDPASDAATPAVCFSRDVHAMLFNEHTPLPLGPMADFLFKPHPFLLSQSLLPLLQSAPAWRRPGPRMCVHLRTGKVDKVDTPAHLTPASVFGRCIGCQARLVASQFSDTSVFLVSDDTESLTLTNWITPVPLSSSLKMRQPQHIQRTDDRVAIVNAYADMVALTLCDVLLIPRSGFSVAAAQWSQLPLANIKFFTRRYTDAPKSEDFTSCPNDLYHPMFYGHIY
jgi:hypothetical protein